MRVQRWMLCWVFLLAIAGGSVFASGFEPEAAEATTRKLVAEYGDAFAERIALGVDQAARRWWEEDGDVAAFEAFCLENFVADPQKLAETFARLQVVIEQIDGHLHEIQRELSAPMQLDTGEVAAIDTLFGDVDLAAHVDEDLFRSKVAFVALLNFPVHTLTQRLEHGESWDRDTWAASRMMDRFAQRVPARVAQEISKTFTAADHYIAGYNIRMDRLLTPDGQRLFPEGLRLITHWGLRDELKSQYAEDKGLERQRMILDVMNRIVRQEIPQTAIDNGDVLWAPGSNDVWSYDAEAGKKGKSLDAERENDARYARLLDVFHAVRQADPFTPTAPTYIDRRFNLGRQIPEKEVEALLISVLSSREFKDTAKLIKKRLGRPLEPFDIWYDGFKARGEIGRQELDRMVRERYPDVPAFQQAVPEILSGLGFAADKSAWLSEHIVVDPSRGAGHAMGAVRREDQAHLRTRFGPDGMDYKGYNIAIHELGHNVEQVFSLNGIDHWWLNGVPNTAFTEALAFVFQNRDLELLGFESGGPESRHLEALDTLWGTAEIGGVALVDMGVWRWMYEHAEATPAELRVATQRIARAVWNRYFAPAFGVRDQDILGIYSHMVVYGLYLPDYPVGHMIAFQVAEKLRSGDFGKEFERMSRQGRLTPDAWMRGAVGQPVSSKALLTETRRALDAMK